MRPSFFTPGTPRPTRYLIARNEELSEITELTYRIRNGVSQPVACFLAPPGGGKTSLLKKIAADLRDQHWLCGYSEASPDPSTALIDLLIDAKEALPAKGLGSKFIAHLEQLELKIWPVGLTARVQDSDKPPFKQLLHVIIQLGKFAKFERVGVALLVDEVQVLGGSAMGQLFRAINFIDDLPIALICAGLPNTPNRLRNEDYGSSPHVVYMPLRAFDRDEAEMALLAPVIDCGGRFERRAIAKAVQFVAGDPLIIQVLGARAWSEACREAKEESTVLVTDKHVTVAIEFVQKQLDIRLHNPIWSDMTYMEQQMAMEIAANSRVERDIVVRLASGLRIDDPEDILARFVRREIIHPTRADRPIKFVDPRFADFVNSGRFFG